MSEHAKFSLEWWTECLAERYFSTAFAGQPVTLSIDDEELTSLTGLDDSDGAAALTSCVRPLAMPGHTFAPFKVMGERWLREQTDRPPPFLPLLALDVLAASRMGTGGGSGHSAFYRPLRGLLDEQDDEKGRPGDYAEVVPWCWEKLKWWLDDHEVGTRGTSTIEPHSHFVHVGYAWNQALVRASDRRQVYQFFHAFDLDPRRDSDTSSLDLRRALALWARRRGPSARRLHHLATDEHLTAYADAYLAAVFGSWDGTLIDAQTGVASLPLQLLIRSRPMMNDPLVQVVHIPHADSASETVLLGAAGAALLENGSTEFDGSGYFLNGADIHAFRRAADENAVYPDWLSTRKLRFGEKHLVLVKAELRKPIQTWLEAEELAEGQFEPGATQQLPAGWFLLRDVVLSGRPKTEPPTALADLLGTAGGVRTHLSGGLKTDGLRKVYLEGGAPTLVIAEGASSSFVVSVPDHEPLKLTANAGSYPLGALPFPPGPVEISHESGMITFDIIRGLSTQPSDEQAGSVRSRNPYTGRSASGLLVDGPGPAAPAVIHPPSLKTSVLLGPDSADAVPVERPEWLAHEFGFQPSWSGLDHWATFVPAWLLEQSHGGWLAHPLGCIEPVSSSARSSWGRLIMKSTLASTATAADELRWQRYRNAASK